ncbi:DUF4382 domain-containing protein [Variovorax soli]|uniref:DUF4382 domain-containing protein n=1 Tax=Variovorax soli TaxID=376815 RepID=A0ABU1ND63_9BURK|nr:DUF4382 domain-containing protein [Variovorax soli]MDR6536408.1 hypothetical protein [Variovorax soli]
MHKLELSLSHSLRALALGSAVALAACGGGGGGGGGFVPTGASSGTASSTGNLRVAMTDAPACGFDHVYVTVEKVRVHGNADVDTGGSGWSDITLSSPRRIDLLSLTNGVITTLGETPLPAGTYQQIRLVLSANTANNQLANSVVPTGAAELALDTPSAVQSGIKIIRPFTVAADSLTDLVLDFDACKSIVTRGNGSYGLKPVVTALPTAVSGNVTGVLAGAPGALVFAERNGVVVKGTVADTSGSFNLSPIEQSSTAGPVDVVIVPTAANGRVTGIIRDVPVTAGSGTALATSDHPISLPTSAVRKVSGVVAPASAQATLRALQQSGSRTFEIAAVAANIDSGAYAFFSTQPALPAGPPVVGTYQATLPIPLTADSAAAGKYSIQATSTTGTVGTRQVDVTSGDLVDQNFSF